MTDATPATAVPASPRPGKDVIAAIAVVFALVVGGAVALAATGGDATDRLAAPGASGEPTAEPSPAETPAEAPSEAPVETTPPAASEAPVVTAAPAPSGSCTYTASGGASKDVGTPPAKPLDVAGKKAVIETSAGRITLVLSPSAPCTTSSFAFLAGKGYFDGTPCHRLTTAGIFVLQCGDPTGSGSGGPGYAFADEALEGATYPAGTVAMANAGPGTNGSQFFLVYDDTELAPNYTPWARVTEGLDALKAVAASGSEPEGDGAPKTKVTITSVTVS